MAHFLSNYENEPDLGDEFKGFYQDRWESEEWSCAGRAGYGVSKQPLYTFYSEEDLVTSAVFQKHLSMALTHKDKNIRELQNEILNYMETK